jgi:hypothetical protein
MSIRIPNPRPSDFTRGHVLSFRDYCDHRVQPVKDARSRAWRLYRKGIAMIKLTAEEYRRWRQGASA